METVGLPYILSLAAVLFAAGIFKVLAADEQRSGAIGVFLMLTGTLLGLIGVSLFLPEFAVISREGVAGAILVLGAGLVYGIRILR